MIQRIQTIYLFFSFLTFLLSLFFFYNSYSKDLIELQSFGNNYGIFAIIFCVIVLLECSLLSLLTIFLYKKRKTQMTICFFVSTSAGVAFLIHTLIIFFNFKSGEISQFQIFELVGIFVGMLFAILAGKKIKQDEVLVKSINRIR